MRNANIHINSLVHAWQNIQTHAHTQNIQKTRQKTRQPPQHPHSSRRRRRRGMRCALNFVVTESGYILTIYVCVCVRSYHRRLLLLHTVPHRGKYSGTCTYPFILLCDAWRMVPGIQHTHTHMHTPKSTLRASIMIPDACDEYYERTAAILSR